MTAWSHTFQPTARGLPMLRRQLVEYADKPGDLGMYHDFLLFTASGKQAINPFPNQPVRAAHWLTGQERERLAKADLYYVDADMCDLITAAYPSMPPFAPAPHDLPAPYGMVVFDRPIGQFVSPAAVAAAEMLGRGDELLAMAAAGTWIWAVTWGPAHGMNHWPAGGTWWSFWADAVAAPEQRRGRPPLLIENESVIAWRPDGQPEDNYLLPDDPGTTLPWTRMVFCAFQLAKQDNLAETETVRTERHERKRVARAGLPDRDVRIVRLRQNLRAERDAAGSGRDYRHRWVVRGHWRNAWYPSQLVHRPRWIAPYIKGPDGAPLLGGERVTVL